MNLEVVALLLSPNFLGFAVPNLVERDEVQPTRVVTARDTLAAT